MPLFEGLLTRYLILKEHLHWQETFRVFTTPSNPDEPAERAIVDRSLPIDEFRFVFFQPSITQQNTV